MGKSSRPKFNICPDSGFHRMACECWAQFKSRDYAAKFKASLHLDPYCSSATPAYCITEDQAMDSARGLHSVYCTHVAWFLTRAPKTEVSLDSFFTHASVSLYTGAGRLVKKSHSVSICHPVLRRQLRVCVAGTPASAARSPRRV